MGNLPGGFLYTPKDRQFQELSTTKAQQSSGSASAIDKTHLETFILVWLDPHVDSSKENILTQKRLREILTCLITFDKVKACEEWLKKCYSGEKIILIVSGAYGEEIVPRIHDTSSIVAVYVYCLDVSRNEIWAKDYPKVRSVQSSTNILIQELTDNQTNLESVEDSKALQIYSQEEQVHTLDAKMASLIWYQLLLEIFVLPSYLQSKGTNKELVAILREYNSGDEYGSTLINQFERTYEAKRAVSWLIRDTPLVRFVNKALREQDINIIFPLRFLLVDIHKQLSERQAHSLNVFKVQLMSRSQMEDLKANPGQLVVIHGFLFASTNVAQLMSAVVTNDQFETVLLDITANIRSGVAPFAFLRDLDRNFETEIDREVLFMCGSIFQVGPLLYENSIWKLQLRLASDNDIPILSNMKQTLRETENLNIIGDLLNQCGQGDKTPMFFQKVQDALAKTTQATTRSSQKSLKYILARRENVLFILLNLSEHMNEFATAVLKTLNTCASKFILIINEESIIDFSPWSKQSIAIFTTVQCASTLEDLPEKFKIFLLDRENSNVEPSRYATIDALIGQLADQIIEKYRAETTSDSSSSSKDEAANKQINRIYRQLGQIHEKYITKQSAVQTSNSAVPVLIWLMSTTDKYEKDKIYIEEKLGNYFSSIKTISHEDVSQIYDMPVFLIGFNVTDRHQFSNVKYEYSYGELETNDARERIKDQNDLLYHLAYDLLDYYGKLGEEHRTSKQKEKARDMFSKAQNLCQLLLTLFPSE